MDKFLDFLVRWNHFLDLQLFDQIQFVGALVILVWAITEAYHQERLTAKLVLFWPIAVGCTVYMMELLHDHDFSAFASTSMILPLAAWCAWELWQKRIKYKFFKEDRRSGDDRRK